MAKSLRDCLQKHPGHVHMVGIGGVGMAGVARLLAARGFRVTGCDLSRNRLVEWLERHGIAVAMGHAASHITPDVDWVVYSAAVSAECPDLLRARKAGRPAFRRGVVLPELLAGRVSVAVCGTHGKTSTASFIAEVLHGAGRDPSWCIGGEAPPLDGVAHAGQGEAIVVEADESDGTLALYRPDIAVVTNIEFDHMEHFASVDAFEDCFRTLMRRTQRCVIYCADDPRAARLGAQAARGLAYGFSPGAAVRAEDVRETAAGLSYTLRVRGRRVRRRVRMPVRGRHSALNSLAVIAACRELGLALDEILDGLASAALPRRRLERVVDRPELLAISDYAHHPSEIAAVVRTVAPFKRARRLAVYQPHRYTRTLALGPDFPDAFRGLDQVVLTPVYAASEKPMPGGTIWDLYAHFRRADAVSPTGRRRPQVFVATSLEQAWGYFRHELRRGDLFLVIGAGDVEKIAQWAAEAFDGERAGTELNGTALSPRRSGPTALHARHATNLNGGRLTPAAVRHEDVSIFRLPWPLDELRRGLRDTVVKADEPLAGKTTLKVGGCADLWAEVANEKDLTHMLRWSARHGVPLNVLGAGSNTLVSDGGVRGLTVRLGGRVFRDIREDGGLIVAGAGTPIGRLLAWLTRRGRSGLEFMEGIPGTLGGAARMNAGAWGAAIGERLVWVRCVDRDGTPRIVRRGELDPGYRHCGGLTQGVIVEAGMALDSASPADVEGKRVETAKRRAGQKAWRTRSAGSVFKNPPNDFAGRLIEQAGLKGAALGGARVSPAHANVIVTSPGARASDVKALMEMARAEVLRRFGIRLETEIVELN